MEGMAVGYTLGFVRRGKGWREGVVLVNEYDLYGWDMSVKQQTLRFI